MCLILVVLLIRLLCLAVAFGDYFGYLHLPHNWEQRMAMYMASTVTVVNIFQDVRSSHPRVQFDREAPYGLDHTIAPFYTSSPEVTPHV